MLDMIRALHWVQDNIAYFHGDASRVTIDGHSAGGCSVGLLMMSPLAKGNILAKNVIVHFIRTTWIVRLYPVSTLHKSTAGRYRPVRVADGPITAHCRFM